jgi:hypothetical protein
MRVKLKSAQNIEVRGMMKTCRPGQIVDVGKQLAMQWLRDGLADPLDGAPVPPKPLHRPNPDYMKHPSQLLRTMRRFWFNNVEGTFDVAGRPVERHEIQLHGGPNPEYNKCPTCQRVEWLSRLDQCNRYETHRKCDTANRCSMVCSRQGDGRWTHFHQDFKFAVGVDPELNAPKCAMIQPPKGKTFLWSHSCDQGTLVFWRQFAQECQFDVYDYEPIDGSKYDFVYIVNGGHYVDPTPALPTIMYCHDLWKYREVRQAIVETVKPDIVWSPFLSSWRTWYKFTDKTRFVFRPIPASMYYTRSNLDDEKKDLDLLCVGHYGSDIYEPRRRLAQQLGILAGRWRVRFHHPGGASRARHKDEVNSGKMPYLNAWSSFLGTARYVVFGGIVQDPQPVFYKYYEVLGSGAIPIMPNAPDLALIGVEPWAHFIPVDEVRENNERMIHFLDNYDQYRHIAENAVRWHDENADRLLFDGFADLVQDITGGAYPRREW